MYEQAQTCLFIHRHMVQRDGTNFILISPVQNHRYAKIYVYIYIYVCMYMYTDIYIYISVGCLDNLLNDELCGAQ